VALSRRQFFRRLVKPGEKSDKERIGRYDAMDAYVRTSLLPYDFALTAEQEAELFAAVRTALQETKDEELFSIIARYKIEEVVELKINPWREASQLKELANGLRELRKSSLDYVSVFLNGQATPATVEQLKERFGMQDLGTLEQELRKRIEEWIFTVEDRELLQYDVVSIKDLIFGQLRAYASPIEP
jgi:hypothetical protein